MQWNLHQLLADSAQRTPEAPALSYRDSTLTYAQTWQAAQVAAHQLAELGIARGDRVAIYLEKRFETVVAMFAASIVGAVFVPVNPVLKAHQVEHILHDSGARFLVTSIDRHGLLAASLSGTAVAEVIVVDGSTKTETVHRWLADGPATLPTPVAIDVDPAAILYTSGSTGKPKGVVLSHRNLVVGAQSVSLYLGNRADDVILSVLPLSFDAGLSQVTTAFAVGAHCVLMNYLVAKDVPKLCARYGVTGLTCVPPLWHQLVETQWPEEATASVRYFANTGGRMPKATLDRLRAIFASAKPYLMYGLTEAFRSTYLDPAEVDRRPDSIGKAIPNAEILVLRPDGTPCGPGEEGELVHRGALVALGYWNDPERTAERYRPVPRPAGDGVVGQELGVWSGDTVVADEDGFLYFVGRKDEMIKTSGYRVSPSEIEEAAYATGLVRDAVAVGVDDPTLGQRVVLMVAPIAAGFEVSALRAALRRDLPLFMVPAAIEVRSELPRSPNGKFDRNLIKAEVSGGDS